MKEQRGLIDALTAETLALREESAALQVRPGHYTSQFILHSHSMATP